jgi:uncharacterized protein with NAD-binding domain and iron-sulfur cluster
MQKIAILGGGIGALATAAELTDAPDWQKNYEITIYQMGWRLGGKGASGRNRNICDRIQEHGIHLWMGFYENAFHLIRRVYAEANRKNLMPTSPFTDARKAFSPMNYTPMMEQVGTAWKLWNLNWLPGYNVPFDPTSGYALPGDESKFENAEQPPTPLGFVKIILDRATSFLDEKKDKHPILVRLYEEAAGHICSAVGSMTALPPEAEPLGQHTALHCITAFVHILPADTAMHAQQMHLELAKWIKDFNEMLFKLIAPLIEEDDELRRFFIIMDTGLAAVAGIIEDGVLQNGFMAIEEYDMIEWLEKHGCQCAVSPITLGMYDACFAYQNGDPSLRRMAAGTTLYGALRLMFTYRGALMWWMNAGMGETIMSPLYLVLKSRGVKFKFFHKIKSLHISADKREIDSVELEIQATTKGEYDPLFLGVDGVPVWPTEPMWEQVVEADEIRKCKNPDLESWWTDWKGGLPASLTLGKDFDLVVLGISLGAHQYICEELIAASPRWKDMVANVGVVRTQGLQVWMNRTLAEAGWNNPRGILSGYVEPFDTWSDMSDLIARERWPAAANVKQIAYFCNAIPDNSLMPFDDSGYPAAELLRVKQISRQFLDGPLLPIFPAAADRANPGHFNDAFLVNCSGDPAQAAFDTQFFRINIDPSELYVLSLPGSARYRLASHESDFANLYLAGDWTLTDLNIGCIEAAVISAKMASRAICGKPDHIYGAFGSVTPIVNEVPVTGGETEH